MDLYQIRWNGFYWAGANYKNYKTRTFKSTYEIDWENHKVKLLDTKETEINNSTKTRSPTLIVTTVF